ncbi:MAG: pyrrolysine--tRNA(Pyl) ligase large subunit [Methanomassiliicoccaceae archaeon]|jgi:pyrrolysyl-tRNA synthetase-like protein
MRFGGRRLAVEWTPSQLQRLKELGISLDLDHKPTTVKEREAIFSRLVTDRQSEGRRAIRSMMERPERHPLARLEQDLSQALVDDGFLEVRTPTIITRSALERMSIGREHPLHKQVFWLDEKRCLRPMLAPNLYFVMRHLKRNAKGPVKIFEIGTCYRKESHGSNHLEEFTMLNLVELDPSNSPRGQLERHISTVMSVVGLDYELRNCSSDVYVETTDVEVNGIEVASGAIGPHKLDHAHGIKAPWAGVGFGIERLIMLKLGEDNVKKAGRSLIYLQGVRLDI